MQGKPKPGFGAHEREVGKGEKMKSIIISIQPKWCAKIESGAKTIEVRKTRPKIETPFKCYIYMTLAKPYCYEFAGDGMMKARNGKVIGEFVCNNIEKFVVGSLACDDVEKQACLSYKEICDYFYGENYDNTVRIGYGWHISELKIYDKPKELGENGDFKFPCVRGGEDFYTHRKCMGCKYARRWAGTMEIYCDPVG